MSGERSMTMKCGKCGSSQTARGSEDALTLLRKAEEAHDLLNPSCPKRWTQRAGEVSA